MSTKEIDCARKGTLKWVLLFVAIALLSFVMMLSPFVSSLRADETKAAAAQSAQDNAPGKAAQTQSSVSDREARQKEAEKKIREGQLLVDRGQQMRDGTIDRQTIIEEANKIIEQGKIMVNKGTETNDMTMSNNGQKLISTGTRMKQGWKNVIRNAGLSLIEQGNQMIKEGRKMMEGNI